MSAEDHTHGPHAILLFSGAYFDVFDTSPESLARVQFVDVLEGLRAAMRWRGDDSLACAGARGKGFSDRWGRLRHAPLPEGPVRALYQTRDARR